MKPQQTFGHYSLLDIQLAQCGNADCIPGYSFGPYIRDFYLLHFVTKGSGKFQIANKEYTLQEGELFFIPPGILTFYQADTVTPWSYTWIGLRGTILPKICSATGLSKNTPVLKYSKRLLDILNQIEQQADHMDYDSFIISGYLCFFADELIKCCAPDNKPVSLQDTYVDTALKNIQQNIYQPISVAGLSKRLGIDRSYFCSIFKKQLGISPQQYIMNLKMEKAKIFLETTTVDIKYIADSLGYCDLYSFSHSFKRLTGISPSEWRQKHFTF